MSLIPRRCSSLLAPALLIGLALTTTAAARSVHVLRSAVIGNYIEDATLVTTGRLAGNVAVLNGYDVLVLPRPARCPAAARSAASPTSADWQVGFDVSALDGLDITGMVHLPDENLFAFRSPSDPETLHLLDDRGRPSGTRTITYPSGTPGHVEGLALIPAGAAVFPGHVLSLTMDGGAPVAPRIQVLTTAGVVVADFALAPPLDDIFFTGIAFRPPNRILLGDLEESLVTVAFDGSLVEGPVVVPGTEDLEAVVALPDCGFLVADVVHGAVLALDDSLARVPAGDRDVSRGIGLGRPLAIAWSVPAGAHAVIGIAAFDAGFNTQTMVHVAPTLTSATPVVNLTDEGINARGAATLAAEGLVAVAQFNAPPALVLFNAAGTPVESIDLSGVGRPRAVAHVGTNNTFLVNVPGSPTVLRVRSRSGGPLGILDLAPAGVGFVQGVTWFVEGGEDLLLVIDSLNHELVVVDLAGTRRRSFDFRTVLGIPDARDVATVTSGPDAGAFSIINLRGSSLTVFRW